MYSKRTGGKRHKHDPSSNGIFIHGGTCLMHGPEDPFHTSAAPNRFGLTFPLVDGQRAAGLPDRIDARPTFQKTLALAEDIRRRIPALHRTAIYACTDLISEKPWCGKYEVQLVSHPSTS